ncbi:RNA recognition motif-containing protein 10 [Elsinoe fawcettii]|nr:RNA recognition motif-containing protein 10 [Elsinoe fawcettii]
MQLTPTQQALLKPYLVTKLESLSSEADCDVLADYLLELVKSEGSEAEVIATTKEQLADFIPDCGGFVDEIFRDIARGAYDPSRKQGQGLEASVRGAGAGSGERNGGDQRAAARHGDGVRDGAGGRKRGREDDEDVQMGDGERYGAGHWRGREGRGMKSARRGRGDYAPRGRRGGFDGGGGGYNPQAEGFVPQQQGFQQQVFQQGQMPFAFDPTNPMAMMQALQQAMGMVQGMQGMNQQRRTGKRCIDYDTKGVCTRGATCPYDHGEISEEQDASYERPYERGRGRGRGRGDRGTHRGRGRNRASFSGTAPSNDTKAIVVEHIPPEHFSEESVRTFFNEFGTIEEVELHDDRKLAIVKYTDHSGATSAFNSPKVVFDNRFVKVYWYRPDTLDKPNGFPHRGRGRGRGGTNGTRADHDMHMSEPEPSEQIDPEEFRKQQEAAQQRFEELKAAKMKREELEAKMRAQAEERAELMRKLAEKMKGKTPTADESATANGADVHGIGIAAGAAPDTNGAKTSSQTEALKAKLAALEAEARSIGINPDAPASTFHDFAPRGRGRGFVPRAGFRGGRPARGAWRGRGRGMYGGVQGGAVKRLDNRPRGFSVVFEQGKSYEEMQEGLKQYMLFSDQIQSAKVSKHPSRDDAALVVYTERYKAEIFLTAVQQAKGQLTHVGKVEVAWVPNAEVPADGFPEAPEDQVGQGGPPALVGSWDGASVTGTDEGMEDVESHETAGPSTNDAEEGEHDGDRGHAQAEVNYDVADDDEDRWMAE